MKFRYYFFKEGNRIYDKAELLTYLEAQPYMTIINNENQKKAYYHNTAIDFDATFVLGNKSIVQDLHKLNPKYLDLNIYVEFEVLNNTFKVNRLIDIIEVMCKRFDFVVYNEYFEDVSQFKRSMLIKAFDMVKEGYKKKYEEEFVNYSKLDKESLEQIYLFLEIKDQIDNVEGYEILPYTFLKEKSSRKVYVCINILEDGPFIIPPCAQLVHFRNINGEKTISYKDFNKKVSKYMTIVDSRLYDVMMVPDKNIRKVRKILNKTKFDTIKVEMESIPFNKVLDL